MSNKFAKVMDNSYTFRYCLFVFYQTIFDFQVDNFYTIMQIIPQSGL